MQKSQFVARGGLLAAASLALLLLASALPSGQIGVCAAAGVLPAAPIACKRVRLGVAVFFTTLLLGVLVVPRKGLILCYAVFGLYSLVKYAAERQRGRVLEWLIKLFYCNLTGILVLWGVEAGFLPDAVFPAWGAPLLLLAFNLVFIAYDFAFSKLIGLLKRIYTGKS